MTYDPPGEPLDWLGRYLAEKMTRMYDARLVVAEGETREIELTKCPYLKELADNGWNDLGICEAHQNWWDVQARSVRTSPRVRITERMRDGAPVCRVVASRR